MESGAGLTLRCIFLLVVLQSGKGVRLEQLRRCEG